ncbi:hypothetical protein L1987_54239 [Smallanthus sonchifolius]|uniref:Uncharacterized protein n=1 Tax=Smallanthus sonchifolius TaxID=185202 RepID=A0ACB9E6H3_9ASTR|nr:hypothetical protein L1987_54239 [Smallanthus sonchifolius]
MDGVDGSSDYTEEVNSKVRRHHKNVVKKKSHKDRKKDYRNTDGTSMKQNKLRESLKKGADKQKKKAKEILADIGQNEVLSNAFYQYLEKTIGLIFKDNPTNLEIKGLVSKFEGLFKKNPIILEENKVRGSTHEAECSKKVSGSNGLDIDETILEICKQVGTIVKTRENDKEEQLVDRVAVYDGDVGQFLDNKKMEGIDNNFDFEAPSYNIGLTQDETPDVGHVVNKKQMKGIDNSFGFDALNYSIDLTQDETRAEVDEALEYSNQTKDDVVLASYSSGLTLDEPKIGI